MTRVHLDHLPHFLVAADTTQLRIREPFPRRALVSQVIEKSFRAGDEWPILAVRPQTHVDAIEITFPRDARERCDHQLNEARISLVLRQRLDRRGHERVVSDQNVEIRTVIAPPRADPAKPVESDSWPPGERAVA